MFKHFPFPLVNVILFPSFEFTRLVDASKNFSDGENQNLHSLGIDKIHFSGEYPALFFKEVCDFSWDDRIHLNSFHRHEN